MTITILGGGLVGSVCALLLHRAGVLCHVVDPNDLRASSLPDEDGRTTAVSFGSSQILGKIGVWSTIAPFAEAIHKIHVYEKGSSYAVHYDASDLGPHPLGYIVDNRFLKTVLGEALHNRFSKEYLHVPQSLLEMSLEPHNRLMRLKNGETFTTNLVIGAEGRHSPSRQQVGIPIKQWDYDHKALVIHIGHEHPHHGHAFEIFDQDRILAVLPMLSCPTTGTFRSGLVFAEKRSFSWDTLDDSALIEKITHLFPHHGALHIVSRRWVYPLGALRAQRWTAPRYALIGDAAHVLHPIAGQGVNLGWRDAQILADQIIQSVQLGLDPGERTILDTYEQKRQRDARALFAATDGLYRLFRCRPLFGFRNFGLDMVNRLPSLKRFLMKRAMGL